jgi:hypothetical protein
MVEESAEATRDIAERFAPGAPRRPKGPNPLRPAPVFGPGSLDYTGPESTDDTGSAGGPVAGGTGAAAAAVATGFESDPADRVGARSAKGRRIGPDSAEDAWMWQGVPPGRALMTRYRPGQPRAYMDYDGGGSPSVKSLPPAWPAGQAPGA